MEQEILETALSLISDELKNSNITLSSSLNDGRLNSAKNEEEVTDEILKITSKMNFFKENNLSIGTPNMDSNNNREWYDFSIENNKENYFMPVNIKVSELDAPDNLNCKLGIFYALTGCNPKDVDLNNGDSWKQFFKKTNEYMGTDENKDYYFLVVNKNDTSDVFWNSLKSLSD